MLSFVVSLMREKRSSHSCGEKSQAAQPPTRRMLPPGVPTPQGFLPSHPKNQSPRVLGRLLGSQQNLSC